MGQFLNDFEVWVPHPCALCKGAVLDFQHLGQEPTHSQPRERVDHPPLQTHLVGWRGFCRGRLLLGREAFRPFQNETESLPNKALVRRAIVSNGGDGLVNDFESRVPHSCASRKGAVLAHTHCELVMGLEVHLSEGTSNRLRASS